MTGLTREEELASVVQAFVDLYEGLDPQDLTSVDVEPLIERAQVALLRDDIETPEE